jgi:hypothetical protein
MIAGMIVDAGRSAAVDLLDLLERATMPGGLAFARIRSPGYLPPGFAALALAGVLSGATAGAHQVLSKHEHATPPDYGASLRMNSASLGNAVRKRRAACP